MKNLIVSIILLSCINSITKLVNLSEFGIPLSIEGPENTTLVDDEGDLLIKAGEGFTIYASFLEEETLKETMDDNKEFIEGLSTSTTFEGYLVEEPDAIMYKTKNTSSKEVSYDFYVLKEVKEGVVEFATDDSEIDRSFTKEEVETMFKAAKGAK